MLNYIWNKGDVLDEYELPEITNIEIEQAEKLFGVKLPASYLDLMREKNGGTLLYNSFSSKKVEDGFLIIDYLLGVSLEDGIGETPYMIDEWELPSEIILLSGDGHSWVVLDYRNYSGENPPISFIDVEVNKDVKIAKDFTDFVTHLQKGEYVDNEDNENIFGFLNKIYSKEELEEFIKVGDDVSEITGGMMYFSVRECDNVWFFEQAEKAIMSENEFQVQDIERAIIKKISSTDIALLPRGLLERILLELKSYPDDVVNKFALKISRKLKF